MTTQKAHLILEIDNYYHEAMPKDVQKAFADYLIKTYPTIYTESLKSPAINASFKEHYPGFLALQAKKIGLCSKIVGGAVVAAVVGGVAYYLLRPSEKKLRENF